MPKYAMLPEPVVKLDTVVVQFVHVPFDAPNSATNVALPVMATDPLMVQLVNVPLVDPLRNPLKPPPTRTSVIEPVKLTFFTAPLIFPKRPVNPDVAVTDTLAIL
jgi:hypothetical protein